MGEYQFKKEGTFDNEITGRLNIFGNNRTYLGIIIEIVIEITERTKTIEIVKDTGIEEMEATEFERRKRRK